MSAVKSARDARALSDADAQTPPVADPALSPGLNPALNPAFEGAPDAGPTVGSEIRELRKARGLTLKQLSVAAGVSLSYLSAIERDAGNPSLDILRAIAAALRVDPNWFFVSRVGAGPLERACVVRRANRRNLNVLYGRTGQQLGYVDSLLSSSIGGRFYMGVAVYAPGADRPEEPLHSHPGEQHGVLIKGELEMTLGDEVVTLRQGDSYSFDARIRHHGRNRTEDEAVLIWAVSPVVIPSDVEDP